MPEGFRRRTISVAIRRITTKLFLSTTQRMPATKDFLLLNHHLLTITLKPLDPLQSLVKIVSMFSGSGDPDG